MTFNNAPWAIDGARSTSALARLATYATGGGRSGVVKPTDLKVLPLTVPGNGLRISAGGAMILNNYLNVTDEAYVVSNPSTHTVLSSDMPAAVASPRYYLVCVVVGDPEFDQTGHPFMPSDLAPEDAADFDYVRVVIVPCTSTTKEFEDLGLHYPAYALARLEIPASTTTITSSMIVDLRQLSTAREHRELAVLNATGGPLTSATYADWPSSPYFVTVPRWATEVHLVATVSAVVAWGDNLLGALRAVIGPLLGSDIGYDVDGGAGGQRETFVVGLNYDVTSLQGQSVALKVQGINFDSSGGKHLDTWGGSQLIWDVQFVERAS